MNKPALWQCSNNNHRFCELNVLCLQTTQFFFRNTLILTWHTIQYMLIHKDNGSYQTEIRIDRYYMVTTVRSKIITNQINYNNFENFIFSYHLYMIQTISFN